MAGAQGDDGDGAVVVHRAGSGEWLSLSPTDRFRFVAEGGPDQPEVYEEHAGRGDGPPLHRHPWPSWELVVDGEVRAVVDDDDVVLGAGDAIGIPAGAAHTYVVLSERAHLVGFGTSGGRFATLQRGAVSAFAGPEGPDMAEIGRLAAASDVELLGPPLDAGPA